MNVKGKQNFDFQAWAMFGARAIKRRRDKEAELKVLTPNTNSQICKYKYTNKQIQIHKHTKMQKLIHRYTNVQIKIQTRTLNSRCSNQIQIHKKANINTIRSQSSRCSLLTEKSHCFQQITFHSEKHSWNHPLNTIINATQW